MAAWKLDPALAAGNCVVLKPAEEPPVSILILMESNADILPAGVLNVFNGFGREVGKALATNPRIHKVAFTGSIVTGRMTMQYATENMIPITLQLGGKSPNIFFEDVLQQEGEYIDKALEGLALFAFNQGFLQQSCNGADMRLVRNEGRITDLCYFTPDPFPVRDV